MKVFLTAARDVAIVIVEWLLFLAALSFIGWVLVGLYATFVGG